MNVFKDSQFHLSPSLLKYDTFNHLHTIKYIHLKIDRTHIYLVYALTQVKSREDTYPYAVVSAEG